MTKYNYLHYHLMSRVSFLSVYFWPSDQTTIVRVERIHPVTKIRYEEAVLASEGSDYQGFAHEMLLLADEIWEQLLEDIQNGE
jgi:hypothetical protein